MLKKDNIELINKAKKEYKIIKKELLEEYTNGYIGKKVYKITLNNGITNKKEQIIKNKREGNASVIIPITKNNKFIIIVESRPNTKEEISIEFPAGMVDENESFENTAKRELYEETGYITTKLIELESHYQDQGCSSSLIKTFIALDCIKEKEIVNSEECITTLTLDFDELEYLYNNNEIKDANTKIAYLTYVLTKNKGE